MVSGNNIWPCGYCSNYSGKFNTSQEIVLFRYGIATPKKSPWRDKISLSILALQERGDIQMLYDKWWKSTGDTCIRTNVNKQTKANALGLDNIGGVFVFLLVGISVAISVAVIEFWHRTQKIRSIYCEEEQHDMISGTALIPSRRFNTSTQKDLNKCKSELQLLQNSNANSIKAREAYCCFETPSKRSLCEEMYEEFIHAFRCIDSHRRPDLKRRCAMCNLFKDVQDTIEAECSS